MATLPETQAELEALRAKVTGESRAARGTGDAARAEQLRTLLGQIDDELDRLALADLQDAANRLDSFRSRLEALTRRVASWPFGSVEAPANDERPFRAKELPVNDFADTEPAAPPPTGEPLTPTTVPQVSAEWSENYRQLWNMLTISSASWLKQTTAIAQQIVANQARYAAAVDGTSVPWWFVAVIHCMECGMRFDQHLHNGDPLSGRTIQVPAGRPQAGSPPFTWEQSAQDAILFERLERVTDWSLPNVLFNWHRYNGINNEYKRRGIPTPYLWSGSTHYRKGKYVADGVFDPESVFPQAGAAVILKALVDLGAVKVDQQEAPAASPAVANPSRAQGDSVSAFASKLLRHWQGDPAADVSLALLGYMKIQSAKKLSMLTFDDLLAATGKSQVDDQLIRAISILVGTADALDTKYLFIEREGAIEIGVSDEDVAKAQKDGMFRHPVTGTLVEDYERKLFPYFAASQAYLAARGADQGVVN